MTPFHIKDNGFRIFSATAFCLVLVIQVAAQQNRYYTVKDVAIRGFDVVSYFETGKAEKGTRDLSFEWDGVIWRFSKPGHRQLFIANPEAYAPRYGGWCAYGVSENYKARTNPVAWTIVDGKLYLNYNKRVKQLWMKDRHARITNADINWRDLSSQAPD
jgi:hypothetical protein